MGEEQDKASAGMKILSFFVPLVGIIIFISEINKRPRYARECGMSALIGFITIFLVTFVSVLVPFIFIGLINVLM